MLPEIFVTIGEHMKRHTYNRRGGQGGTEGDDESGTGPRGAGLRATRARRSYIALAVNGDAGQISESLNLEQRLVAVTHASSSTSSYAQLIPP
jgi:hypothetical protein